MKYMLEHCLGLSAAQLQLQTMSLLAESHGTRRWHPLQVCLGHNSIYTNETVNILYQKR